MDSSPPCYPTILNLVAQIILSNWILPNYILCTWLETGHIRSAPKAKENQSNFALHNILICVYTFRLKILRITPMLSHLRRVPFIEEVRTQRKETA